MKALLLFTLLFVSLSCERSDPAPMATSEPTATPMPTPTPTPETVPVHLQCPTWESGDDDVIELTPWLVSAVKIAIKEKLDDPEVLEKVYPKLYFYDSGFPHKEPIPNREPKISAGYIPRTNLRHARGLFRKDS